MKHPIHHARVTPEKIAYQIAQDGASITFAELDSRANQGAQALRKLGVESGDHIAFLLENRLEFMEICWAAQRAGVIFTPISRYLQSEEAAYIVADCGAKVFITSTRYAEMGVQIRALAGKEFRSLTVDEAVEGFEDWNALVESMPDQRLPDESPGATMLYSSGTTGRPKGILKQNQSSSIEALSPVFLKLLGEIAAMDAESVYLSPAPLYHSAPLGAAMVAAGLGATTIIMERFDEEGLLREIESAGVTHTQVVPTMFVRLLKMPTETRLRYDTGSLVTALHVAAPCPVDIKRQMIGWWGPILLEYYAGTEGNGVTAATTEEWNAHPGTVGRALFGSIRILDDEGLESPRGEIGNVYFDTGLNFSYHNDPEKTAQAYNKEGWSTLGDIGWLDEDGFLHLTDRRAYTIISGGVNVYPQETEDLLVTHPSVADVAVFGVPNEELGEEVKAVVQPVDTHSAGPELEVELIAFCRSKLSVIKTPKSIDFRRELPRTATGKLIKRHLKAEYWPS
ncbi:acyl-CoA synthetase [Pelagibius sp. Alg239-R121]|uniref:acyl-CoA synthetase n=1 Tax=Pelagibius sp. Alg239-R121 TaxID=2993448 RepID=UPI0024A6ADAE|nr:acyl-CoA synthetase [Pelagibius sp. Alg239-R121]